MERTSATRRLSFQEGDLVEHANPAYVEAYGIGVYVGMNYFEAARIFWIKKSNSGLGQMRTHCADQIKKIMLDK